MRKMCQLAFALSQSWTDVGNFHRADEEFTWQRNHCPSAHSDPWRSVGSLMFSFLFTQAPVSPIRALQAYTSHIHAQLQASDPEKTASLENDSFGIYHNCHK